jgi:hypothetical protein
VAFLPLSLWLWALAAGAGHQLPASDPESGIPSDSDPATQVLNEVWSQWAVRRSEVLTADIRFRRIHVFPTESLVAPADVAEVVKTLDFASLLTDDRPLLRVLDPERPASAVPAKCRLILSGKRVRYEWKAMTSVRDNALDMIHNANNRQVDVASLYKSGRRYFQIQDLRFTPPEFVRASAFRVKSASEETVQLESLRGDVRNSIDRATGILSHTQTFDTEDQQLVQENWEQAIVYSSDGIPFPTVRLSITYERGRLTSYELLLIDSADFNVDIPEEHFRLALDEGTTIVDFRSQPTNAYALREATTDLARTLDLPQRRPPRPRPLQIPTQPTGPNRWLLALNGLMLIAGGLYIWRRTRRRSPFDPAPTGDESC